MEYEISSLILELKAETFFPVSVLILFLLADCLCSLNASFNTGYFS